MMGDGGLHDAPDAMPDDEFLAPRTSPLPGDLDARGAATPREWLSRTVRVLGLLGLVAALCFGTFRTSTLWKTQHPVSDWLSWRYAACLAATTFFAAACFSIGHAVLRRTLGATLPLRDRVTFALPVGMLAFFFAMFVLGMAGALGRVLFFALPIVLLALGLPDLIRLARSLRGRRGSRFLTFPLGMAPFVALGAVALLMMYVPILEAQPNYDSRWYHLRLAEHYAAQGRIGAFPEGWMPGAMPQLASVLFTWAFAMPGSLFQRTVLASHLEFLALLATLPTVGAFVRAVVPRASGAGAWTAYFLFPTIFICKVGGSSDHVVPLFAVPAVIGVIRAWRRLDARPAVLAAIMISGIVLTKYTGVILALPLMVAIVLRGAWLGAGALLARRSFFAATRGGWLMLAVGVALTTPFWLRNLVYYGNPLYPTLSSLFPSHPWHPDASQVFSAWATHDLTHPEASRAGLKASLAMLYDFGGESHDLATLSSGLPIFGVVFTLMACALPFLRARPRLWAGFALGHAAVFTWLWVAQQERYLLVVLPLLAGCTAAAFQLAWRAGWLARVALAALVLMQTAWAVEGAFATFDATVIPRLATMMRVGAGPERFRRFAPWPELGAGLPRRSKVVIHELHDAFGLGLAGVQDFPQWQYGLSYARLGDPRSIHDRLRSYGATHVLWLAGQSKGHDSIGGDLAFHRFVSRHVGPAKMVAGVSIAPLLETPPAETPGDEIVAFLGCKESYTDGLYHLRDLHVTSWGPPRPDEHPAPREPLATLPTSEKTILERAVFLVHNASCGGPIPDSIRARFPLLLIHRDYHLYMRAP